MSRERGSSDRHDLGRVFLMGVSESHLSRGVDPFFFEFLCLVLAMVVVSVENSKYIYILW